MNQFQQVQIADLESHIRKAQPYLAKEYAARKKEGLPPCPNRTRGMPLAEDTRFLNCANCSKRDSKNKFCSYYRSFMRYCESLKVLIEAGEA